MHADFIKQIVMKITTMAKMQKTIFSYSCVLDVAFVYFYYMQELIVGVCNGWGVDGWTAGGGQINPQINQFPVHRFKVS